MSLHIWVFLGAWNYSLSKRQTENNPLLVMWTSLSENSQHRWFIHPIAFLSFHYYVTWLLVKIWEFDISVEVLLINVTTANILSVFPPFSWSFVERIKDNFYLFIKWDTKNHGVSAKKLSSTFFASIRTLGPTKPLFSIVYGFLMNCKVVLQKKITATFTTTL